MLHRDQLILCLPSSSVMLAPGIDGHSGRLPAGPGGMTPSSHAASAADVAAKGRVSQQQQQQLLPLGSAVGTSVLPARPMLGAQQGFSGAPFVTQPCFPRATMGAVSGATPGAAGKRADNCRL
jgi:hypothetical protein